MNAVTARFKKPVEDAPAMRRVPRVFERHSRRRDALQILHRAL